MLNLPRSDARPVGAGRRRDDLATIAQHGGQVSALKASLGEESHGGGSVDPAEAGIDAHPVDRHLEAQVDDGGRGLGSAEDATGNQRLLLQRVNGEQHRARGRGIAVDVRAELGARASAGVVTVKAAPASRVEVIERRQILHGIDEDRLQHITFYGGPGGAAVVVLRQVGPSTDLEKAAHFAPVQLGSVLVYYEVPAGRLVGARTLNVQTPVFKDDEPLVRSDEGLPGIFSGTQVELGTGPQGAGHESQ